MSFQSIFFVCAETTEEGAKTAPATRTDAEFESTKLILSIEALIIEKKIYTIIPPPHTIR